MKDMICTVRKIGKQFEAKHGPGIRYTLADNLGNVFEATSFNVKNDPVLQVGQEAIFNIERKGKYTNIRGIEQVFDVGGEKVGPPIKGATLVSGEVFPENAPKTAPEGSQTPRNGNKSDVLNPKDKVPQSVWEEKERRDFRGRAIAYGTEALKIALSTLPEQIYLDEGQAQDRILKTAEIYYKFIYGELK